MGAVLFQKESEDGQRREVECASAKFTKTETRYHANEQEVLAVIWGVKKFRQFLEDQHFTLYMDSRVLLWLDKNKDEKSKLMRWALMLQAYNFTVVHVPGKYDELPDFLSRNPEPTNRQEEPEEVDERTYHPVNVVDGDHVEEENVDDLQEPDVHEEGIQEEVLVPGQEGVQREAQPQASHEEERGNERARDQEHAALEDDDENDDQPPPAPLFDLVLQEQKRNIACQQDQVRIHDINVNGPRDEVEARAARRYFVDQGAIWRRKRSDKRTLLLPEHMTRRVLEEYHDAPLAEHPGRDETLLAVASAAQSV